MPRKLNTVVPSPDPLPRWLDLPLNSKLPMLRAPQGALVLHRTKLSRKLRKNYPELDFDLNDPHSYGFDNSYKPLHDVYLRHFLGSPDMKKRLRRGGFVTNDDNVLCSLKEYNQYRAYLRGINLSLEKRRHTMETERLQRELKSRRQRETVAMLRRRDEHIKRVQERLSSHKQEDRIKFMALAAEREQWNKEQIIAMTEAEREANRKYQKKQEIRRKVSMLRRWLQDDLERTRRIEERKIEEEEERRLKLEDEWERRKVMQAEKLEFERQKREAEEQDKSRRIEQRQEMLDQKREQQQVSMLEMISRRRSNRSKKEADYQRRLRSKIMEKQRKDLKGQDADEGDVPAKSYWNVQNSLERLIVAGLMADDADEKGDADKEKKGPKAGEKVKEEREQRDRNLLYVSNRRATPYHADGVIARPSQILAARLEDMGIVEGSEENLEDVAGSELDECRCSLIKLHKVAKELGNFDEEAKALASNLHEIMSDLKLGKLQPYQVEKLTDFATDILQPHLPQPDHVCDSPSPLPIAASSNFAKNIISQLINCVQDSLLPITDAKKKPSDLSPLTKSLAKRAIATTTSKILNETDALMEKPPTQGDEEPSLRKSYTSDLVKVVLQKSATKILRDMRGSVNSNAELKAYIEDIIQQCMQELVQEYLDEKAPKPSPIDKKKPNYVSVASMLVRDTITDVIKELCEQSKIPSPFGGILPGTASAVFVESLILETIRECLQELKDKEVSPEKLVDYATDILASHAALKKRESKEEKSDDKLTMECGYQKASSTLLDGLIFHLVSGALRAIEENEINSKQMKKLEGVSKASKSTTDTTSRVTKALHAVLEDIGGSKPPVQVLLHWDTKVPLQDIVFSTQAKSLESLHAETAVLQALHDGQKKVYAPQESSPDLRAKSTPPKQRKLSAAAERCVSMVLGRAVNEYFSDKKKTDKDKKLVSANVDDLVDYSVGLVIMQLANESQGGEAKIPYPTLAAKTEEPSPPVPKGVSAKSGKAKSLKKKKGKKGPPNFATKPPKKKKRAAGVKADSSPPPRPITPPPQNKPKSEAKPKPPEVQSPKASDEEDEKEIQESKTSVKTEASKSKSVADEEEEKEIQESKASVKTGASKSRSSAGASKSRSSAGSSKSKSSEGSSKGSSSSGSSSTRASSAGSSSTGSSSSGSSKTKSTGASKSKSAGSSKSKSSEGSSSRSQSAASAQESKDTVDDNIQQQSGSQLSRRSSFRASQGSSRRSLDSGNNTANSSNTSNRRRSSGGSTAHIGHTVVEGNEFAHSDESDDCSLEPMVDNQTMSNIDPAVVENNLSVLSVKRSHDLQHFQPNQAVARNSFRSLVSPNVHKVRRFSNETEDEIANHIEQLIEKHESGSKTQHSDRECNSNESSASEDDAPAPGEKDDLVSVTEIHTAEELNKMKQLSKEKAEQLSQGSNTSVRRSGSKGSEGSVSGKSSSKSMKSGDEQKPDDEENQGSKVMSASNPSMGAKSAMSVKNAQSKSENASHESLDRRADIPTSDTDQAIKAQESRSVKSANSVDRESGKGSAAPSGDEKADSDNEEADADTAKNSEVEEDNTETAQEIAETKSFVPDGNDTSEAKSITDPTQLEESEATKEENASDEEDASRPKSSSESVQLTPKASTKDLPPTDAGSGSGTAGNDSPAGSAGLSPKSSMSSLDGKSRARLSHAHDDGPKTTSSEMAAEDMHVEKPHSPVGSLPDMQTPENDESETKE